MGRVARAKRESGGELMIKLEAWTAFPTLLAFGELSLPMKGREKARG